MSNIKCQHEWEYFDEHDFPNGYKYDQWDIPHKRCKKCGREYELFDGYGEYANRWRKVEPWSPELHKLEQELIRTRKALEVAKERLKNIILDAEILATPEYLASRAKETLEEITALEQKD